MNMMKKWMFVVLVAAMVGLAGCGDGDDDVPTGDNNGQLQDTGQQQDTTPAPDADDPQDAGHDAVDDADGTGDDDGGLADGGDATDGDATDGGDAADDETPTYSDDISYREYREASMEWSASMVCKAAWECESEAAALLPHGHRFNSQEACQDALDDADAGVLDPRWDHETDKIESLIDAGRIIFDSEQAATCLNTVVGFTPDEVCDPALLTGYEGCSDDLILSGTIGELGSCIDSEECAGDSWCQGADSCDGRCFTRDSPCGGDGCSDDEFCDVTEDPSVCETRKTEGAQCNANSECGEGLECMALDDDERGVCRRQGSRQRGESCSDTYFCEGTDRCIEETCVEFEFVEQGDPCEARDICEPGTRCRASTTDAVVGTCESPGEVGESCSSTIYCEFGLYCDGATNDQMGSCAVLKADGSTCDSDSECENGICESDTCGGDDSSSCPVPS